MTAGRPCAALLAPCLASATAQPARNFASSDTETAAVSRFLEALQVAVAKNDRQAAVGMFACPCVVWDGSKRLHL